jgi:hypothetical protein
MTCYQRRDLALCDVEATDLTRTDNSTQDPRHARYWSRDFLASGSIEERRSPITNPIFRVFGFACFTGSNSDASVAKHKTMWSTEDWLKIVNEQDT